MLKRFFPDIYIESVFSLPMAEFEKRGIKALFFDIDNTVAPFDEDDATEEIIELFENLKKSGYKICLLSNNNEARVVKYNEKLKVMAISRAGKPGIKKIQGMLKEMGVTKDQAALIGDQVFTDMYCAHRAGIMAVLTEPICERDQLITKVKRGAERQVLKVYKRSLSK